MEIKDRVLEMKPIDWQSCQWLQPKGFKVCFEKDFLALVKSLQENDFSDPFRVWQDNHGTIWILDGHHRQKALEYCLDGKKKPPKMLNAIFMDCKNKKEAAKLCILYAAEYARISDEGLYQFLHEFDLKIKDIDLEIRIPGIDFEKFNQNFYDDPVFSSEEIEEFIENKNKTSDNPDEVNTAVIKIEVNIIEYQKIKRMVEKEKITFETIFFNGLEKWKQYL